MTRILVVDNYDSFVFNIVSYLVQLGAEVDVLRNDEVDIDAALAYDGILISPGPGTPQSAGVSMDLIRAAQGKLPVFGVCLGHQAIAAVYGATVDRAPELLHGKTSEVSHEEHGVFKGLPRPFTATRYHSLAVQEGTVPDELEVTARSESGVIMGIRHRQYAIEGVQFHPESVLTEGGYRILANWLEMCGDTQAVARSASLKPLIG
ncbi:MAG: aminodeoxychorismate/anthranilate synthase component II [Candidatus Nanopelagicales bacterium]